MSWILRTSKAKTMQTLPPISKYFEKSYATLYNEDCLVGMPKRLGVGTIDVVVTSPPYNLGTKYATYNDSAGRAGYLKFMDQFLYCTYYILKYGGSLFLNMGGKPTDPWVPYEVLGLCRGRFFLQNVIHWVKSVSIDDGPVRGHIKPINSHRFMNDGHEFIFHLTKTGDIPIDKLSIGVPYADVSNLSRGSRGKNGNIRDRGNVWFMPYETVQGKRSHPATFPVELPLRCIKLHGLERTKIVIDPFMGIGTTALAAIQLGINFVGFEIDPKYVQTAADSLPDQEI